MRLVAVCVALFSTAVSLPAEAATVSVAHATMKIRPSQAPLQARSASISAARNEVEAFQILVTGPATGVVATASPLSNGSRTVGPVRLYREELIRISTLSAPDAIVQAGESLPDALVPDVDELDGERRNAFVRFDVPAGVTRAIWAEVRVPADAPPGAYTGSVAVRFAEGSATVPVTLTVHDFTLPARSSLETAFGLHYGGIPAGHGISASAQSALRARYGELALDHRVTLSHHDDGDHSLAHFDAAYGPLVSGTARTAVPGAALTAVEYVGSGTSTSAMAAWWSHFEAQGWGGGRLFQYTCDEPPATCRWTDIPPRLAAAKAANPAFRTLLTSALPEIRDAESRYGIQIVRDLEIVTPVINYLYDRPGTRFAGPQAASYATFLASGPRKELWAYQSCMSHGCGGTGAYHTGWPSYMIDASAVRNRAMQWLLFQYGVTGELYYETAMAYSHDPWSNQWDFTGNGDGTLFYPGTPARIGGTTHIPVASIRLKLIREGLEDYEYLKALSDLGDRDMALREAQALFPTAYQTEADPAALLAARERIARRIVELRGGAPALSHGAPYVAGVAVDGNPADFPGPAVALADAGADVKLAYDDDHLYASFAVRDAALVVNQGGRDGEVWNGDSVEVMLEVGGARSPALGPAHHHVLVNVNGDLTDERGAAGAWDRSWTSGAAAAVSRTSAGYTVELRVPWSSLGVAPCAGLSLGLDFAVNDVDVAGAAPRAVDWARLARFAQPNRWGTLVLTASVAGGTYVVQRAPAPVVVDGSLSEFARAPAVSLDESAAAAGSDDRVTVRLLHDATHLYAAFRVQDGTLRFGQGGRDGEVWNGDGVELLLDLRGDRTAAPNADDRHLLVNVNGDLTDERGNGSGWDRSWTSDAAVALSGAPGSYTVELAVPWTRLGVAAPAAGAVIGLDLANNDSDAAGSLVQFDWARLTRFAVPASWRRARFEGRVPACTGTGAPAPPF